jgi:CheY-like chemotaxis protein
MDFRPESVDVGRVVSEVRDILRGLAASKRLRINVHISTDLGLVTADPARLKQVLYNYLSNAIKFTPEGGDVTVRAETAGPDLFRIDVEDTGIGVASENLGKLFVEFQQLDASAAKKYQGTGLGLALTKRIIEAQGGRVEVRSTSGEGSTFSAILPRVATLITETRGQLQASTLHDMTVLVVDADPAALRLAEQGLAKLGCTVVCRNSAEAALDFAHSEPIGLVVLDLLMPGMTGIEFISRFRELPGRENVPILVWTARDLTPVEKDQLIAARAVLVVKAPDGTETLVAEVGRRGHHLLERQLNGG